MSTGNFSHHSLILVVDDEPEIRNFIRSILETAGHAVLDAGSGDQALRLLEEHDPKPDLLLTDIVMPGMTGIALAAQAHQRFPGIHVLFMSGYAQDFEAELSGSVCVAKPFKSAELVSAIQSALGRV